MLKPEIELSINRLSDALRTSFEWIVKRDRENPIGDIAEAWADLTASALQDVRLMAPPIVDHTEPFLPFIETHKIRTDLFRVARSGMRGGPWLDLIFQVWLDTEGASGGFGVPLIMRKIPSAGRMPELVWSDLREAAKKLNVATPSGRIVLFGDGSDFDWGETRISRYNPIIVMNAHTFASMRTPPHPVSGHRRAGLQVQTCRSSPSARWGQQYGRGSVLPSPSDVASCLQSPTPFRHVFWHQKRNQTLERKGDISHQ